MIATAMLLASILGQPAPDWPGKPSGLGGKVVLVRFFTDTTCPYCAASAPALRDLHRDFASRGLVVIGVYTPKPEPRPVEPSEAHEAARRYGFDFPIVVDGDWGALRALWLDRAPGASYTSASLLVDRRGIVRYVHEGGAYSEDDVKSLRGTVGRLVKERP